MRRLQAECFFSSSVAVCADMGLSFLPRTFCCPTGNLSTPLDSWRTEPNYSYEAFAFAASAFALSS
jgi:hypothetical protein